jgi:RNA polymerase sigma factor (TIGR02999 family)
MATDITLILERWRQGDESAPHELAPRVYAELRRIAQRFLRSRPGHTLQPTALVNEAWLKLFHGSEFDFTGRAHFLAVMSRAMRQVLIDYARSAGAAKRWGGQQRVDWDANIELAENGVRPLQVLDVDRALQALALENPSLEQVLEMHYFAGMTAEEVAAVVNRPAETVRHEIRLARAWLRRELGG